MPGPLTSVVAPRIETISSGGAVLGRMTVRPTHMFIRPNLRSGCSFASQQNGGVDFCFGSKADITALDQCPLYPRKRTSVECPGMSALCQKRLILRCSKTALFDHLVSELLHRKWNRQSKRF